MAESFNEFSGVYSLRLTPFNEDRSIDYKAFEAYAERHASLRARQLFPACGSSEVTQLHVEVCCDYAKSCGIL